MYRKGFSKNGGGKEAYKIAIELIEKNEFHGVSTIGRYLAENGGEKEAYKIAMKLKEKNAHGGGVWHIGVKLAEKGFLEEAKEIAMNLIEKNAFDLVCYIGVALAKNSLCNNSLMYHG